MLEFVNIEIEIILFSDSLFTDSQEDFFTTSTNDTDEGDPIEW